MLVRKCDICDHIIGDEVGYMVDIFKTSMPRGAEERTKTPCMSFELCYNCKVAMLSSLNKRLTKRIPTVEEQEGEE